MGKLLVVATRFLLLCSVALFFSLLLTENVLAAFISASPTQGPSGTGVTVSGSGWPPSDLIHLSWNFPPFNTVASIQADGNGAFTATITVPQGAPIGHTRVNAINEAGGITWQAPFEVTEDSAQSIPPGWYSNNGPSIIYDDGKGRSITWQNSYIYQHPGPDNLYWYAEVLYLNTASVPWPITCSGATDPSLAKEHIRGTEGLPPGTSGYVPADETFCSRNPSWTGSIEPGGTHYSWAIFHNVPPGGEVFLEWYYFGSSPWVNPWGSSFSAPPPAECPQELVTLGTCLPVSRKPEGKAPNLIVLVHGCCTNANDVRNDWDSLGRLIAGTIIQNPRSEPWEIVVWDWHNSTPPPPDWQSWLVAFQEYVNIAYDAAENEGNFLANDITRLTSHAYKYIHLIGHSAGAKLIHEAATDLIGNKKIQQEKPFIHLTFLDAYTRTKEDSGEEGGEGYGYLEDYPDHFAEHYVDIGLPATDAILTSAFNFDITNWEDEKESEWWEAGHQWPRRWYTTLS